MGLGGNLGDRGALLAAALERVALVAPLQRVSSLYESDPVGFADQPAFWNLAASIRWSGTAAALLGRLKAIERALGRKRTFRNGPRVIDCDVLDFGGLVATGRGLVLPHPRLPERRFALAPLAEIAPRWRHPVSGLTARQLLARLPQSPRVHKLMRESRSFAALGMALGATAASATSSGLRGRRSGA